MYIAKLSLFLAALCTSGVAYSSQNRLTEDERKMLLDAIEEKIENFVKNEFGKEEKFSAKDVSIVIIDEISKQKGTGILLQAVEVLKHDKQNPYDKYGNKRFVLVTKYLMLPKNNN